MSSAKWAEALAAAAERLPIDAIGDALTARSWWVGEDALPPEATAVLAAELDRLEDEDRLRRAGIGRETDYQIDRRAGQMIIGLELKLTLNPNHSIRMTSCSSEGIHHRNDRQEQGSVCTTTPKELHSTLKSKDTRSIRI